MRVSSYLDRIGNGYYTLYFFLSNFSNDGLYDVGLVGLSVFFRAMGGLVHIPFFFRVRNRLHEHYRVRLLRYSFRHVEHVVNGLLCLFYSVFATLCRGFLLRQVLGLTSVMDPFVASPTIHFSNGVVLFILSNSHFRLYLNSSSILEGLYFLLREFRVYVEVFLHTIWSLDSFFKGLYRTIVPTTAA